MQDYEAIAARLANALRDMLKIHEFSKNHADYQMVNHARSILWDFDNWPTASTDEGNTTSDSAPYRPTGGT